jgi:GntR family transcriptional regulator, transcriptional repressor for pyruvate dehydrogenase complex
MNGQSQAVTARPARLPLWLADQVEEDMLDGDYLVDAQLPTESALAARYGVSRQVVREAARLLEDRGLVNIRAGRGMTVAAPGVEAIVQRYRSVLRRDGASFSDLMQLRQMIEVDMSALAARNRTEADVARMREILAAAREHLDDYDACLAADLAFHMAVAQATQNPFVLMFAQPINMVLRDVYSKPIGYLATQENTLREHGAIADAIAAGDADAARSAAAAHLSRVVDHGAQTPPPPPPSRFSTTPAKLVG